MPLPWLPIWERLSSFCGHSARCGLLHPLLNVRPLSDCTVYDPPTWTFDPGGESERGHHIAPSPTYRRGRRRALAPLTRTWKTGLHPAAPCIPCLRIQPVLLQLCARVWEIRTANEKPPSPPKQDGEFSRAKNSGGKAAVSRSEGDARHPSSGFSGSSPPLLLSSRAGTRGPRACWAQEAEDRTAHGTTAVRDR